MDHESVQATALKVVFDLLHVFGFEAFNITSHTGSSTKTPDKDIDVSSIIQYMYMYLMVHTLVPLLGNTSRREEIGRRS